MDVISNNRNQEYLKAYNKNIDESNYSNITLENSSKVTKEYKVHQSEKKEKNNFDKEDLDESIKKLNKLLEDDKTHAEYEKHKDLGILMVKIIDDETEKVIVELPPEKVIDMIASLCKQVGILDKKA